MRSKVGVCAWACFSDPWAKIVAAFNEIFWRERLLRIENQYGTKGRGTNASWNATRATQSCFVGAPHTHVPTYVYWYHNEGHSKFLGPLTTHTHVRMYHQVRTVVP
jgi:hypothetical protein